MTPFKTAIIAVTAATIVLLFNGASGAKLEQIVSPNCLGCLCEASTQCNVTAACHTPFAGAYYCGPFLISRPYWQDAGQPVIKGDNPANPGAFEHCANDLYCAAQTVRGYMKKFTEKTADCNGDGLTDCRDFAFMHRNGGYGCTDKSVLATDFYLRFETCWNVVNAATLPSDNLPATGVRPPAA